MLIYDRQGESNPVIMNTEGWSLPLSNVHFECFCKSFMLIVGNHSVIVVVARRNAHLFYEISVRKQSKTRYAVVLSTLACCLNAFNYFAIGGIAIG